LYLLERFKDLGYQKGDFLVSEEASKSVLSLPIYLELNDEKKEYAVQKIYEFYKIFGRPRP